MTIINNNKIGQTLPVRCTTALGLMVFALCANGATPTVNGYYYGDGDNALYGLYTTNASGSELYTYYDAQSDTLYAAIKTSQTVNDTVCSAKADKD